MVIESTVLYGLTEDICELVADFEPFDGHGDSACEPRHAFSRVFAFCARVAAFDTEEDSVAEDIRNLVTMATQEDGLFHFRYAWPLVEYLCEVVLAEDIYGGGGY